MATLVPTGYEIENAVWHDVPLGVAEVATNDGIAMINWARQSDNPGHFKYFTERRGGATQHNSACGWFLSFTDANVAFAFKMRFG
ncbi:MAG: hypothetical protein EOP83_02090 [Verrucomicrobiaceae bacterium]|nr:MAG: hypothetical protein EOP83_02090 [Verrucomicrobiaceae bacterium]